jgi:O-antigen/teichoic acid export membrane protein
MVTQLKRNTIANLVGSNWPVFLGLVFVPLYIRFLGMEAYGLIGFFATLQSLCTLVDFGISATLNREMARLSALDGKTRDQRDLLLTLEPIYWGLSLLAGILIILFASGFAHRWVNPQRLSPGEIENAFRLMGCAVAVQLPSTFYQGGLMGLQRQVPMNIILVIVSTLRTLGAIFILWKVSSRIEAFFAWQAVVSCLQVGAMRITMWRSIPSSGEKPKFRKDLLLEVWRYAAYISGNAFVGALLSQTDKVILIRMLPLEIFGYYTLALSIATCLWSIIVPINTTLFPQFVQLHEKRDEKNMANLLHHASQVMSVAIIPIGVVLIFFSREILFLWTRDPIIAERAHLLVSLLVMGVALNGISSVPSYASAAFGWPQLVMYVNIGQAFILFPAILLAVPYYGAVGAAVIWVIMHSTYLFVMLPILFRRYFLAEKWNWYLRDIAIPLAGVLSIGLISRWLQPGGLSLTMLTAYIFSTLVVTMIIAVLLASTVKKWMFGVLANLWGRAVNFP